MVDELGDTVEKIGTIYPAAHRYLKKQSYFSEAIQDRFRQGCIMAIKQGTASRATLSNLSSMALSHGDLEKAIEYHRRSMAFQSSSSIADWRHLAELYLKKGDMDQSFKSFLNALVRSEDVEKEFRNIYSQFSREKRFDEFIQFIRYVEKQSRARVSPWILVKCFMDMGQLEVARARLQEMNTRKPSARVWYLLAQIEERQQNWDAMELASQRATVLDSHNRQYQAYFIKALKRNGKHDQAREAALRL